MDLDVGSVTLLLLLGDCEKKKMKISNKSGRGLLNGLEMGLHDFNFNDKLVLTFIMLGPNRFLWGFKSPPPQLNVNIRGLNL